MEYWNTAILGNSSLCGLHSSYYSIISPFRYSRFILYPVRNNAPLLCNGVRV
jgi:hypothetical protein